MSITVDVPSSSINIWGSQVLIGITNKKTEMKSFYTVHLKYILDYILNDKVYHEQIRKLKDCWIVDQNTFNSY